MKVILNQDVIGLGEEGDIKDVADGYARNFLLPKKLAVPHTREFLAALEHKRASIEKRKEEKRLEAAGLKERLEAEEIRFSVPAGRNGKLFGSVNNTNVAVELEKKGFKIEKKSIEIPEHTIRNVGHLQDPHQALRQGRSHDKAHRGRRAQPGASARRPSSARPVRARQRSPQAARRGSPRGRRGPGRAETPVPSTGRLAAWTAPCS